MRTPIRLTLAGLLTLGVLITTAAPAGAAVGYANLCPTLKTALCTPGGLEYPNEGVAVDNSSGPSAGDVWFTSGYEGSLQYLVKFDASGNRLAEIGNSDIPAPAKPFSPGALFGVAVDPANGDVYVSNREPSREEGTVTKFDSSGVFQYQLSETPQGVLEPTGVAVDPSNGDLYVADMGDGAIDIDKFTSSGTYIEQLSLSIQSYRVSLAFGPEDDLYVGLPGEVRKYTTTGAPVNCPGADNALLTEGGEGGEGAIAVDPSDGHIFAVAGSIAHFFIAEYDSLCVSAPSFRLGTNEFAFFGLDGIGVSGSSHQVYAGNVDENFALTFGVVTVPDARTAAPVGVTRTSATVSGTVNPDETSVTTCEFEYGSTASYGHSEPCSQELPLKGNSPIAVSAEIKPPEPPAGLVHYRLKVGNSNGVNTGEDERFNLEALPSPIVGAAPASNLTQFSATLNATLQTGEAVVDYHFEYGTSTAYGSIAPIPDRYTPISDEAVPISQTVGNLQAGTTYHYRLVASSPGGTEVAGPDQTFTTLAIPAPAVQAGAAIGVGVGAATLDGAIDPHGWDTTYLFQYGTSTAYGSSWPTIPVDIGALEGSQPVVVGISNLLPSTTYHYRLIATNGGGTSYGPDETFTTAQYPASIIQETRILGGPAKTPAAKTTKKTLTSAQKLAKALKACEKQAKRKRATCEKRAMKKYAPPAKRKAKGKKRASKKEGK
ncbi:MAG TPA: hypothetical protein VGL54_02045 [Solirubrobacteraceae bacterium]